MITSSFYLATRARQRQQATAGPTFNRPLTTLRRHSVYLQLGLRRERSGWAADVFGLFKRKPAKLLPESRWTITLAEGAIHVVDDRGNAKSVQESELSGVAVETNDSGPWGADVWWLLFGSEDRLECAFPQGATGEQAAVDYLMALPSFDDGEMIDAMRSTGNAVFPLWRRT